MCASCSHSVSISVDRVIWKYNGDVNSALGENSKEPSSSTVSTEASFNDDSNEKTLKVIKVCQQ